MKRRDTREVEEEVRKCVLEACRVTLPPTVKCDQVLEASNSFFIDFPIDTARLKTHLKNGKRIQDLETHINSAYPVLHHRCLPLYDAFLRFKRTHGTPVEKSVYEGMSLVDLVDRLLLKRPVTFLGRDDQYLLRDGSRGKGGFEKIGHTYEERPLCLRDYLSYDEMKLSALLSVSSPSYFINNGSRKNHGVPGAKGSFQESGIIVGMVGARLKKEGYMEWQDCVVTPKQNTPRGGYGPARHREHLQHLWARLWGKPLPLWEDASPGEEFLFISKDKFLNVAAYKSRIQLSAETLIAEANTRASAAGVKAYIHVVGLGLGVWRASPKQDSLFVDAWGDAIRASGDVKQVAHIDFSWIGAASCQGIRDGEVFPGTDVVLHFTKRSLHDPVPRDTLLVVCYAWDGNALPGNEYWIGKLSSTGDGAAACSSSVAELHNAHINKTHVRGSNLHVAGPWGVRHVAQYFSCL